MPLRSPIALPVSLAFLGGVASGVLASRSQQAWVARTRIDGSALQPAASDGAPAASWRLDERDLCRELPGLCW